jgi:hypothetical protein
MKLVAVAMLLWMLRCPYLPENNPLGCGIFYRWFTGAWGNVVVKALRYLSDGLGIIPDGVNGDFFRSYRQNHVPWGRLSL